MVRTGQQLLDLAVELDAQSGYGNLCNADSWHAEELLSPINIELHRAAMALYHAAALTLQPTT